MSIRVLIYSLVISTICLADTYGASSDTLRKYHIEHVLNKLNVQRVDINYYWGTHVICEDKKVHKAVLSIDFIESFVDSTHDLRDILIRDTIFLDEEWCTKLRERGDFVNEDIYAAIQRDGFEKVVQGDLRYFIKDSTIDSTYGIIDAKEEWLTALIFFFDRNLYSTALTDISGASVVDLKRFEERYLHKSVIRNNNLYRQKWSFFGELLEEEKVIR